MTLKEKYEAEIKYCLEIADSIEKATNYTDSYLSWGSSHDSSENAGFRVEWVKIAEKEFLEKHKKEILKSAADKLREYAKN